MAYSKEKSLNTKYWKLIEKMEYLDSFQEICDLQEFVCKAPTDKELEEIIGVGNEIDLLLTPMLEPVQ